MASIPRAMASSEDQLTGPLPSTGAIVRAAKTSNANTTAPATAVTSNAYALPIGPRSAVCVVTRHVPPPKASASAVSPERRRPHRVEHDCESCRRPTNMFPLRELACILV